MASIIHLARLHGAKLLPDEAVVKEAELKSLELAVDGLRAQLMSPGRQETLRLLSLLLKIEQCVADYLDESEALHKRLFPSHKYDRAKRFDEIVLVILSNLLSSVGRSD